MNKDEVFIKNLILSNEFSRYVIEHPEFGRKIPRHAQVLLLPDDDPELAEINLRLAEKQREKGQPQVCVRFRGLAPARSRLLKPQIDTRVA